MEAGNHFAMPNRSENEINDRTVVLYVAQRTIRRRTLKVFYIFDVLAILVLAVCTLLLIQKSRIRPKQPEDKPKQPQRIRKRPGRRKRRPKGQTGRKHPKGKRKEA